MLDIRRPIGWFFSGVGVLLVLWGIVRPGEQSGGAAPVNANLWWGVVVLAFGIVMWGFARRRQVRDQG